MTSTTQNTSVRQHRFTPPPGACDLLLVRHGESQPAAEGQVFPTVDGHADPPLCEQGLLEAERVAERLQKETIDAIYTTTLTRTKQTAAPLATALGITPQVEPELREIHLGEWEGAEFRRRMAAGDPLVRKMNIAQDWAIIPGAESIAALNHRVRIGIDRIAAAHPDQRVVAFVHAGIVASVLHMATNSTPFAFLGATNASISHIVITDTYWVLRRFNDTAHLPTDLDKPPAALK